MCSSDLGNRLFFVYANQIEYSLSFCARITRLYAEASTGAVKSLDDFTRLAASNWDEAYHLFYIRNFLNRLRQLYEFTIRAQAYLGIAPVILCYGKASTLWFFRGHKNLL